MNTLNQTDFVTDFRPARTAMPAMNSGFALRPRTLGQAIQAAVDTIADAEIRPLASDTAQSLAQARAVLALLARCYAQQIYHSADVASLATHHPDYPWFWCEALPGPEALRRFRVENRDLLHRCLVAALRFQAEENIFAGALDGANGVSASQLAGEAGRRIMVAAFEDSRERVRGTGIWALRDLGDQGRGGR